MKPLLLCTAFLVAAITSQAQTYREIVLQAEQAYANKNFTKSVELYEKAFTIEKKSFVDLYNAACSAALAGSKVKALHYLETSIKNGWTNINHLQSDTDLQSLHESKKWRDLVALLKNKIEKLEASYDKPLQKELLEILHDDQSTRLVLMEKAKAHGYDHPSVDSLQKIMQVKDSINLKRVTRILDERGWVGKDVVGPEANNAIFLVIQHADYEVQKKYLPIMRDAVKKGNAASSALALLEDRIAIREGRKQIYGSQIGIMPETNEHYVLPLEDPDNVDKRRSEVGLGPLSDYVRIWNFEWDPEEYKKRLPEFEKLAQEHR